jgi:hypothetical protein
LPPELTLSGFPNRTSRGFYLTIERKPTMPTALPILDSANVAVLSKPAISLHPGRLIALWAITMLLVGALAYTGVGTGGSDDSLQMLTVF